MCIVFVNVWQCQNTPFHILRVTSIFFSVHVLLSLCEFFRSDLHGSQVYSTGFGKKMKQKWEMKVQVSAALLYEFQDSGLW